MTITFTPQEIDLMQSLDMENNSIRMLEVDAFVDFESDNDNYSESEIEEIAALLKKVQSYVDADPYLPTKDWEYMTHDSMWCPINKCHLNKQVIEAQVLIHDVFFTVDVCTDFV